MTSVSWTRRGQLASRSTRPPDCNRRRRDLASSSALKRAVSPKARPDYHIGYAVTGHREEDLREGHRRWPHIQGWAGELGLTGPEAVAAASQPPNDINREHEQADGQPDREAAD
jgi:hypothetical protein